jgi:hypothetical protein
LKKDNIAWFASHTHFGYPTMNDPYHYSYLFKYEIALNGPSKMITLPDNDKIKIFAITVAKKSTDGIRFLQPIFDDFSGNSPFHLRKQDNSQENISPSETTSPSILMRLEVFLFQSRRDGFVRISPTRKSSISLLPISVSLTLFVNPPI